MLNPQKDFQELSRLGELLKDQFDRLKVAYRFDKKRVNLAKNKVDRSIQIISNVEVTRELPEEELRAIHKMIMDVASKGRPRVMFQRTEDESAIEECFSGQIFKFK